jgi:hypothetical protein
MQCIMQAAGGDEWVQNHQLQQYRGVTAAVGTMHTQLYQEIDTGPTLRGRSSMLLEDGGWRWSPAEGPNLPATVVATRRAAE